MQAVLGNKRVILILLAPALIVYTLIMLVPVLWSLGYMFFSGSPLTGFHYTGFANITHLFHDPEVGSALLFTLKYAIVITIGQVIVGYGLALLYVFVLKRGSNIVRTLIFFPIILPTVAVAELFQKVFAIAPQQGLVNSLFHAVGLSPVDWFGSAGTAFLVLVIMDIWRSMGFYGVLLYAGLLDIPDDVLEAARIDGANSWKLIQRVILPLSLPVLLSSFIFSINGTLKVFDSVIALTNVGPGTSTTPLTLYMFQTSFTYGSYGYGAAIATLLTLLCLVATMFIFVSTRRDLRKA